MCGRYTLVHIEKLSDRFQTSNTIDLDDFVAFIPQHADAIYNVSPGFNMPVITNENTKKIELMKWGLIPHWAKDTQIGYKLINARSEGINTTAAFKNSFKSRRCLVPASGFYEWKKVTEDKSPYYIRKTDATMMSFAGLYDIWVDVEGKEIRSYTIITTEPNKIVESIHNRMPVILTQETESIWLNQSTDEKELLKILVPYEKDDLEAYQVSKEVNKATNQAPDLLEAIRN